MISLCICVHFGSLPLLLLIYIAFLVRFTSAAPMLDPASWEVTGQGYTPEAPLSCSTTNNPLSPRDAPPPPRSLQGAPTPLASGSHLTPSCFSGPPGGSANSSPNSPRLAAANGQLPAPSPRAGLGRNGSRLGPGAAVAAVSGEVGGVSYVPGRASIDLGMLRSAPAPPAATLPPAAQQPVGGLKLCLMDSMDDYEGLREPACLVCSLCYCATHPSVLQPLTWPALFLPACSSCTFACSLKRHGA